MWVALIAHKRGIDQVIGSGNRIHLILATKKKHNSQPRMNTSGCEKYSKQMELRSKQNGYSNIWEIDFKPKLSILIKGKF